MSKFLQQQQIILASGSKSRQLLLQQLGLEFQIILSHCDEEAIKKNNDFADFFNLAEKLAAEKALAVSQHHPAEYIIAADQLCVHENKIYDKPGCHEKAVEQLQQLQGKQHLQISAVCIAYAGKVLWHAYEVAYLTMRPLSPATIESYLRLDKPYQSCGAYHFEGHAKWLFSEVRGNEATIQGLAIIPLCNALLDLKIAIIA